MSNARFVFDTNVTISALLFTNSVPGQAFWRALRTGQILLSVTALEELNKVLSRPKFVRYVTIEEREEFLKVLVNRATFIDITEQIDTCRDPKDNKFLELAVSGHATCIISGDDDLRVLHPFRDIPILSPMEFLTEFASS